MMNMVLHGKNYGARCVFALGCIVALVATGCASNVLKRVDEQESPMLKLVIARDMITQYRYELALRILRDIKVQYASNEQVAVEVDYEIAFIALSRKQYEEAQELLEAIVAQYDAAENKNSLIQWPYYLSKRLLETSVYPVIKKQNKQGT